MKIKKIKVVIGYLHWLMLYFLIKNYQKKGNDDNSLGTTALSINYIICYRILCVFRVPRLDGQVNTDQWSMRAGIHAMNCTPGIASVDMYMHVTRLHVRITNSNYSYS